VDPFNKVTALDPRKKARTLFEEFKNFAFKGNVVDLAIGVIIGGAFGGIVKSLVDNVVMPLVSVVLPGAPAYEKWAWTINGISVPYGLFLASVVNFLILALVLYLFIVKFLGWVMRTKKEEPPPPPTRDQELLAEIRDLLKKESARAPAG
jgi:large conductance mechanosensitive channel